MIRRAGRTEGRGHAMTEDYPVARGRRGHRRAFAGKMSPAVVTAERFKLRIVLRRARKARQSPIDVGCVALLLTAVLIQGVVVLLGLPHRVELLGDLAAAAMLVSALIVVLLGRATIPVPYLAIAFAAVLMVAAV